MKSAPLTIIRKSPLKNDKKRSSNSGSGGSGESASPSNPKLDDVLLKTMNASTAEVKSALPNTLTTAPLQRIKNAELPVTENTSNSLSQRSLVDLPEEPVVDQRDRTATAPPGDSAQLHIPAQGTTHKFFGQQRVKKTVKHEEITSTKTQSPRTLSFKTNKDTTSQKHMINRTKSVDGGHLSKGARPKFAESTVNNLVPVVEKCDIASFQRTGSLNQGKLKYFGDIKVKKVMTLKKVKKLLEVSKKRFKHKRFVLSPSSV